MRKLSQIADHLLGQPMFKLLGRVQEMEAAGRRIHHFEIGDSDFRAHQHIIDATKRALDADMTHYVPSCGVADLREAICEYTAETLGFRPVPEQVLVMPSNAIIDVCLRVLADPGDEVVYPDPGFSTYLAVTNYTGIRKVGYPLREINHFRADAFDMAERITARTRLLIHNSPNNPTGSVTPCAEVERIAELAAREDLYLLSDEIYSQITYDGAVHVSPAQADHCRDRTIILNGFAKNFMMPGWRLGYAIGPKPVIRKMTILFETMYSCLPAFIQAAGVTALRADPTPIQDRIQHYDRLRRLIVDRLNALPGVTCAAPEGACYVFPNITGTGMSSAQFAEFALEQAGVALLPGTCFGEHGEGYVRLCYTRSAETITWACERLHAALRKHARCYDEVAVVG